jgi:aminoglycoside/choline kinase family phosphotransferase
MKMDQERQRLRDQWITSRIGSGQFELTAASEDASFRRYFRLRHNGRSEILMDAPPDREDSRAFAAVAEQLLAAGVNAPRIIASDFDHGWLLLTDFGQKLYLDALNAESADRLYGDAIAVLVRMQTGIEPALLPPYDETLLREEMELFRDWLVKAHLGLHLRPADEQMLTETFAFLAACALEQPRVFVHRDYHSRNLMVTAVNNPGVLDFQDAVRGPIVYDLVSLLRDCYIKWPHHRVSRWFSEYLQQARAAGLVTEYSDDCIRRWFDLMGVQRHLKASGIFARLYHRDAKPSFLDDIPRTLSYITEVATNHPELGRIADFINNDMKPPSTWTSRQ